MDLLPLITALHTLGVSETCAGHVIHNNSGPHTQGGPAKRAACISGGSPLDYRARDGSA